MKRMIQFIVTLVLCLALTVPVFAYTDVPADASWKSAAEKLQLLGIMSGNGSTFQPNGFLTREQLAKMVVVAANQASTENIARSTTPFPDISLSRWSSGYIRTAAANGYITGMSDGLFHPAQTVTVAQAATVLVRMLGYTDKDLSGTWPTNYMNQADLLDITDGLGLKASDPLPRWAAAVMLSRMLDATMKTTEQSGAQVGDQTAVSFSEATGLYQVLVILADNTISADLGEKELRTSGGILKNGTGKVLTIGQDYRAKVENGYITAVYGTQSVLTPYTVAATENGIITWRSGSGVSVFTLPAGVPIYANSGLSSHATVQSSLKAGQTAIFGYSSDKLELSYVMVSDPSGTAQGSYIEALLLETGETSDTLTTGQLVTDKGNYTLNPGIGTLSPGYRYGLFVSGNVVTAVYKKLNTLKEGTVLSSASTQVRMDVAGVIEESTLPQTLTYYHDGKEIPYNTLSTYITLNTTIVYGMAPNGKTAEYAILYDPLYSAAQISNGNVAYYKSIGTIVIADGELVLRNGDTAELSEIQTYDVAYEVTDIHHQHAYVEVIDQRTAGYIRAYSPSRYAPQSITVEVYNSTTKKNEQQQFSFGIDFQLTSLTSQDRSIGTYVTLLIGRDGKIVKMI